MDESSAKNNIEDIVRRVEGFNTLTEEKITQLDAKFEASRQHFTQSVALRINYCEVRLISYFSVFTYRVNQDIIRMTFHASPEFLAILTSIWKGIQIVWKGVQFVAQALKLIKSLGIHDLLYQLWPWYRNIMDTIIKELSELSASIGWGLDGIMHLLNATKSVSSVISGIAGDTFSGINMRWMDKTLDVRQNLSDNLELVKTNPGALLDVIFKTEGYEDFTLLSNWSWEKFGGISKAITLTTDSVAHIGDAVSELSALQVDMPEFIRKNIPQGIWDGLADAESAIEDTIKPALTKINNTLEFVAAIQAASIKKFGEISERLAHPGDVLLGVDDLPDYMKDYQQKLIDDVTSREFELWTDMERDELGADLEEFDRIDRLATAPTPEPAFLTMEVVIGKTVGEITAEYKENWFVGDY